MTDLCTSYYIGGRLSLRFKMKVRLGLFLLNFSCWHIYLWQLTELAIKMESTGPFLIICYQFILVMWHIIIYYSLKSVLLNFNKLHWRKHLHTRIYRSQRCLRLIHCTLKIINLLILIKNFHFILPIGVLFSIR